MITLCRGFCTDGKGIRHIVLFSINSLALTIPCPVPLSRGLESFRTSLPSQISDISFRNHYLPGLTQSEY